MCCTCMPSLLVSLSQTQFDSPAEIGSSSAPQAVGGEVGGDLSVPVRYACSAVHGFFRSIALSGENSLQDTLRSVLSPPTPSPFLPLPSSLSPPPLSSSFLFLLPLLHVLHCKYHRNPSLFLASETRYVLVVRQCR